MKLFAVLLGALALAAGFTGGLRAYSTSAHAGPPVPTAQVAAPHYPHAQVVRPGPVVRWAPCVKPAVRVGKACVTTVTRTVALPAPAATTTAPATAAPAAVSAPHVRHSQAAGPGPSQAPSATGGGDDGGGGGHDD